MKSQTKRPWSVLSLREAKLVLREIYDRNPDVNFRNLNRVNVWKASLAYSIDLSLIALSIALFVNVPALFFVSLILIGSRQRALSNLTHDGSHGNLFGSSRLADFVVNVLGAYLMFETVQGYKKSHMAHHKHLGSLQDDPDAKTHFEYGYDDNAPERKSAWKLYSKFVFNKRAFLDSLFGPLFRNSRGANLKIIAFWIFLLMGIAALTSASVAAFFIILWLAARATSYHAIRILAEFFDHAGLEQGTILGFSRNLPHDGLLRRLISPHEDTFHIIHHLFPKIPHYNLRTANSLLHTSRSYASAEHCQSYFFGKLSAIRSWTMGRQS